MRESRQRTFTLPETELDIYEFCFWAGNKTGQATGKEVLSVTLKKYLQGLKAWHTFHDSPYPIITEKKVALILKSSAKLEATFPKKSQKKAVMIEHLIVLANDLSTGSLEDLAILDMALIAFWGLARLGELTLDQGVGGDLGVYTYDVDISSKTATIELRRSKTAAPGESQFLKLKQLTNILCPVKAVSRRLAGRGTPSRHLFGYTKKDRFIPLSKYRVKKRLADVWGRNGYHGLSGHSFRVGGARS
ncbi:uncharacterized protein PGTG_22593 [Puccinia graminis f. sp. tritici CRL 75-36-700-3]|uniref:Tyr recombinase domain-containing protein n=1 Tax=Puccinia graminis f. sp. tritici (strain CRL 75-36-700-3 / race SCCL) TaxID=418459 RepID=H6QV49_PUCGT|nr:uncharacterized protein PGTG_22593 [Puccinia graminis f. sp. tritici CRL 75-36-700-3]EHS62710.1 hypothetical protein PGTG_22593 [Puccinia graminis f. sp. tritici CRL 75-36-700-3]